MLRFHATNDRVLATRFAPDGHRLVVATGPAIDWTSLAIWRPQTGTCLVNHELPRRVVALSNDASQIAIRSQNSRIAILHTLTLDPQFQPVQTEYRFLT